MRPKGRPKKPRQVRVELKVVQFSPRGKPGRPDEVLLSLEQLEAMRLADLNGQYQSDAAKSMGVSRPTFGRILKAARKTIVDALVNGKIIRIENPA